MIKSMIVLLLLLQCSYIYMPSVPTECNDSINNKYGQLRHPSIPVYVKLLDNMTTSQKRDILENITYINTELNKVVLAVSDKATNTIGYAPYNYFINSELAITQFSTIGNYYTQSDIYINGSVYNLSYDFKSLLLHELGHLLGLNHINERNHVMFPYQDRGVKIHSFQPRELNSLHCIYSKF